MSQIEVGKVLWIPPLGWEVGYFFWGWVIDRFARAGAALATMRRLLLTVMWLSLPLALVPRISSLSLTMAMLFFAMFVSAGFIMGSVAYATSQYSARYSGLIAGLGAGSWSAVVALAMPGIGRLFDLSRYDIAFGIAVIFPIIGYTIWRILSRQPEGSTNAL
jgi:ACS family hexuronate transporter-like MFS transporter